MKTLVFLLPLLLTGCGYSLSEMNAAKAACSAANGEFSTGTTGLHGTVDITYCSIDGIRYRIGRTEHNFHNGRVDK